MPATSDFRLYHSNALEILAGLLADELRRPAPGQPLLAPDTVLVPQVAMRRWLQATLAKQHGIAANLEFLTPGEFVRRALDANEDGSDHDLDATALHWRLYAALTDLSVLREPALLPLRGYLAGDDPLRPWTLAGELAASSRNTRPGDATGCWLGKRAPRRPNRKRRCGGVSRVADAIARAASTISSPALAATPAPARCQPGCHRACLPSPP
jgi:hypothetical protein